MIKKHFICEECESEFTINGDDNNKFIEYNCPFCDEYHYNEEMLDDSE